MPPRVALMGKVAELNADLFADVQDAGWTVLPPLPWPPSVNDFKIPHPKVRGVYFLSKRAKQFREDAQWLLCQAPKYGTAEVDLEIDLHPPDCRRRDGDNWNKAIWDALEAAGVIDDDSQIREYRVRKCGIVPKGAVIVRVRVSQ